jgi:hypothetical protein
MLLASDKHTIINIDTYPIQLVNLLNELLARQFKIIMARYADPEHKAYDLMQRLFGIDDSNSPMPNPDVLVAEPTIISVRESCQHWADIANESILKDKFKTSTIDEFIHNNLISYVQTFDFALKLQSLSNWQTQYTTNPDSFLAQFTSQLSPVDNILTYLNQSNPNVLIAMFLQSILHTKSSTRTNITNQCVFDPDTLSNLIIDLRMAIYFDRCKIKREKWLSVIGDVTYGDACASDLDGYTNMIGAHTHGLSYAQFWSLLRAAIDNPSKLAVFSTKSNYTVNKCIAKIQKKMNN